MFITFSGPKLLIVSENEDESREIQLAARRLQNLGKPQYVVENSNTEKLLVVSVAKNEN